MGETHRKEGRSDCGEGCGRDWLNVFHCSSENQESETVFRVQREVWSFHLDLRGSPWALRRVSSQGPGRDSRQCHEAARKPAELRNPLSLTIPS